MSRLRDKITYANVTATLALFIAIGGTGYAAVQLPRNSVGRAQLRSHAVGRSELGHGAVTSRSIKDHSIAVRDMSSSARKALTGAMGPQGPKGDSGVTLHAGVNSAGALVRGNATAGGNAPGDGVFTVQWATDVSNCDAVATLASLPGGPATDPPAGRVTVRPNGTGIEVHTFDALGTPTDLPFSVVAAC